MKVIITLLSCILFANQIFATSDLSQKAEKLYEQKNYKEAVLVYESILNQNNTSAFLYYNIGNCYFKTDQIGKAIYNYELAAKMNPNNQDIKVNLKIANTKTIDKIENKENYFIGALKSTIINYYTSTGWAWISIISFASSLILLFLFFVSKQLYLKRIGFFIGIFCLILFIGSMILGYSSVNYKHQMNYAIILQHEVKILSEPNIISETKFNLHEGTKVSVLSKNNQWVNIKLENGNEGWVNADFIGLF